MPWPWIVCGPTNHSMRQRSPSFSLRLVQEPHLGELVGHGLVGGHAVEMPPLDHERPRGDQRRHLGVVERAAQVELEDLVLAASRRSCTGARVEAFFQTHSLKSPEQIDRQ